VHVFVSRPGFLTKQVEYAEASDAPLRVELRRAAAVQVRIGPVLRAALGPGAAPRHGGPTVRLESLDGSVHHEARLDAACALFDAVEPGAWRVELQFSASAAPHEITAPAGKLTVVEY
jgi:hypothetical protein